MTAEPTRIPVDRVPLASPPRRTSRLSRTVASSVTRRRKELLAGNHLALRHGIFAVVANLPDVEVEVELAYAARPGLDLIRDRRLVEAFALAIVQHRRVIVAMDDGGLTEHLTAYEARLAPLVERLERTVHERELQRLADRAQGAGDPFARYRAGGGS